MTLTEGDLVLDPFHIFHIAIDASTDCILHIACCIYHNTFRHAAGKQ